MAATVLVVLSAPTLKFCFPSHLSAQAAALVALTKAFKLVGFSVIAAKHCQACLICARCNVGKAIKVCDQAAHPPPLQPFEHLIMDFIELTPAGGKKYCLVMVDMWSKWVEAFPCSAQLANDVAKALQSEILPCWGIRDRISFGNGTDFVNYALSKIAELGY